MTHRVKPGQTILFHTRDAVDVLGTIAAQRGDTEESEVLRASILDKSRFIDMNSNFAHPMAGPVYIEGAEPGDVLKVTIISIDPGEYGYTFGSGGFIRDLMEGQFFAIWRLNKEFAVSDDIPNVRIPNASFPGIVSTIPESDQLQTILHREQQLADAGGQVMLPVSNKATPSTICGPDGSASNECLRTSPPRERWKYGHSSFAIWFIGLSAVFDRGLWPNHWRSALFAGRRRSIGNGDRDVGRYSY